MESLDSRLQHLAAIADQAELPLAADVRRRGEARRRHRHVIVAAGGLLLLAAIASPVAIVLAGASTPRISPPTKKPTTTSSTSTTTTTVVSLPPGDLSTALPPGDLINQITVSQGRLLLGGGVASTSICVEATMNPQTLELASRSTPDCNDPALDGETVGIVNSYVPSSNNATISIAHVDPRTGQRSVGPVVMTYGSYSDTRPVTAYGGGWLWIYDDSIVGGADTGTVPNPATAELLQVSTSSGRVVNTVSMPTPFRPIMAANDVGLWIGNSLEGGVCSGCSPPAALYYVAPGSDKAVVAISNSTFDVCWLLGSDNDLWAGIGHQRTGCSHQTIWRLDGSDFQPVFAVSDDGYHPNTVIGDESVGLWTMQWTHPPTGASPSASPQEIVGINPDTGAERVVATLPPLIVPDTGAGEGLLQGEAAVLDGSLYLLEPPFQRYGYLGYSTLVRVRLP